MAQRATAGERIGVLFMQSQEFFGADSQIHASLMAHLDRARFEVHCAAPAPRDGRASAALERVRAIDDVAVRLTEFGPSVEGERSGLMRAMLRRGVPAAASLAGLAAYVRRHRIGIVHCTEKPRDAIFGRYVAALGGAGLVIHAHVAVQDWMRRGVRRAMDHADAIVGVSEFIRDSIVTAGYPPERAYAVLNGLEVDQWTGDPVDVQAVRAEWGIPADAPMLLSASRLYRYKGQHEIVAALPRVKEEFPDVRLVIVGEDDPRSYAPEPSYTATLKRMAAELGVTDNVIFTGFVNGIRPLMAACDLYVMPSHEEPFGMVFVEAMSLERPVVALDNGGTREVVEHGRSGLLSERGDTAALAEHICTLLRDPGLRARMGAYGRTRVLEYFNAERMTRDMEHVYERVVTARRRRSVRG